MIHALLPRLRFRVSALRSKSEPKRKDQKPKFREKKEQNANKGKSDFPSLIKKWERVEPFFQMQYLNDFFSTFPTFLIWLSFKLNATVMASPWFAQCLWRVMLSVFFPNHHYTFCIFSQKVLSMVTFLQVRKKRGKGATKRKSGWNFKWSKTRWKSNMLPWFPWFPWFSWFPWVSWGF